MSGIFISLATLGLFETVALADYDFELFSYILLTLIILNTIMDSSMTASMVAFATSVDSIPLPEFVALDSQYVCIYCHLVLNMPRQLPCGHRICKLCVDKLFQDASSQSVIRCPSGDLDCEANNTMEKVMQCYFLSSV